MRLACTTRLAPPRRPSTIQKMRARAGGMAPSLADQAASRVLADALHPVQEPPLCLCRAMHRSRRLLQRPASAQRPAERLEQLTGVVDVERAVHPEEGQRLRGLDAVTAQARSPSSPPPARSAPRRPTAPPAATPRRRPSPRSAPARAAPVSGKGCARVRRHPPRGRTAPRAAACAGPTRPSSSSRFRRSDAPGLGVLGCSLRGAQQRGQGLHRVPVLFGVAGEVTAAQAAIGPGPVERMGEEGVRGEAGLEGLFEGAKVHGWLQGSGHRSRELAVDRARTPQRKVSVRDSPASAVSASSAGVRRRSAPSSIAIAGIGPSAPRPGPGFPPAG